MKILQVTGKTAGEALAAARAADAASVFLFLMRGVAAAFEYFPNWFRETAEDFWNAARLNAADGQYRWFVLAVGSGEAYAQTSVDKIAGCAELGNERGRFVKPDGDEPAFTGVVAMTLEGAVGQIENWQPPASGPGAAADLTVVSGYFDPNGSSLGVIRTGDNISRYYGKAIGGILQTIHDLKL